MTSAAFVMVGVFAIFGTLSIIDYKMLGVGLAFAILIDATIVRAVLLPATMKLLGDRNWYLPSWLQWLPRFDHEGSVDERRSATAASATAPSRSPLPRKQRRRRQVRRCQLAWQGETSIPDPQRPALWRAVVRSALGSGG